jgi:cell division control protein 6
LVLDELDAFAPSTLSLIFGLPGRFPASLRVVAISNDLTQSLASPTLSTHRPSLTLAFPAYTAAEMQEIIRARLVLLSGDNLSGSSLQPRVDELAKIIQPAALTLLVKKVSSQTGDIRQALEVLRRAIELAAPAATSLESDDTPPSPVGMSHVIDAVKRTKAPGIVAASAIKSTPSVNGGGRGPLDGCVSALGLQARLVLVTILIARRRAAHSLPLDSLSPSTTFTSASSASLSPSKSKMRRCASLGSGDAELSPSKVYTLYSNVLRASPSTPFEPVSRSEYTDLLGVLETASLVVVPSVSSPSPTKPKRVRKGASFSTGMSATTLLSREEGGSIALCAAEDEVLRALLATAGALDAEVTQIWERESKRIERALIQRSEVPAEPALDREDYL